MVNLGVVLFALAITLHVLAAQVISERLDKLASDRRKRDLIASMWSRLPR